MPSPRPLMSQHFIWCHLLSTHRTARILLARRHRHAHRRRRHHRLRHPIQCPPARRRRLHHHHCRRRLRRRLGRSSLRSCSPPASQQGPRATTFIGQACLCTASTTLKRLRAICGSHAHRMARGASSLRIESPPLSSVPACHTSTLTQATSSHLTLHTSTAHTSTMEAR